jgi:hypothetical protein
MVILHSTFPAIYRYVYFVYENKNFVNNLNIFPGTCLRGWDRIPERFMRVRPSLQEDSKPRNTQSLPVGKLLTELCTGTRRAGDKLDIEGFI